MSFRALHDGSIVAPATIPNQEPVECLKCGSMMYARSGKKQARHFYHIDADAEESCSKARIGESDTHARCAALAVAALNEKFGDQAAQCGPEVAIDVDETATKPDQRRADALLKFETENPYFGNGLIVEVQHKHYSKDIEATTHDYLSAGYSVVWLASDEFDEEQLDYSIVEEAFHSDNEEGYSVREHDAWEFETRIGADLSWEKPRSGWSCFNYVEFGEHAWEEFPEYVHSHGYEYEICRYCGVRRRYDRELTRFVYDYDGILAPEISSDVLRDSVVPYWEIEKPSKNELFEEWLENRFYSASSVFEVSVVSRTDVAGCRGPNRIHEWDLVESLESDIRNQSVVELRECRHCPVHLLTDFRGYGEDEPYILFGDAPDSDWNLAGLRKNPWRCSNPVHQGGTSVDYCVDCGQPDP